MDVLKEIQKRRLIAIVRNIPFGQITELAQALYQGGITCMEVTFDQSSDSLKETLCSIEKLRLKFEGKIFVGAGTVISEEQVALAVEAGAEYIISPNTDQAVIEKTKGMGKISIPGAMTPTEVAAASTFGADLVKVFPAGVLGPEYIKALQGPLGHIPLTAVGGIRPDNCADFIRAGASGIGCGGKLVSPSLVKEQRFDLITDIAKKYIEALDGC